MQDSHGDPSGRRADQSGTDSPAERGAAATPCRCETISARFLLDDLAWLQQRLARLEAPATARERELADFYRALAAQRREQLEALRTGHPRTWMEFLR